jgi:large-conductance mechanosensitive channel
MSTTMAFPRTQPLQAASVYTQQATAQQTGGIDISTLMNFLLPAMVIGMMAKMMSSTLGKKKQVKVATTESTASKAKKATTAG